MNPPCGTFFARWLRLCFWPIACAFIFCARAGSTADFNSRGWQVEDGLPGNVIQAITQTADGYLWIGTAAGLVRFDGVKFTEVFLKADAGPKKNSPSVTTLFEDRDKTLWIGTEQEGAYILRKGELSSVELNSGTNNSVRCIFQSRDGTIWLGKSEGVSFYKNGSWQNVLLTNAPLNDVVREIREDKTGDLWLATSRGLKKLMRHLTGEFESGETILKKSSRSFCITSDGAFWIGTLSGLTKWSGGESTRFTKTDGLQDNVISALYEDKNKNLWIGSYGGLHRLVDGKLVPVFGTAGENFGQINTIYEDREGSLWLGTRDGLQRLNAKQFSTYTKEQGLTHENVMSVFEDHTGSMWFGTWGGGLNKLKYGAMSSFTAKHGLSSDLILGLGEARNGSIWIGTDFEGGLFHLFNGHIDHYGREDGLVDSALRVVFEDREEKLWIGTRTALYIFSNGKFTRFTTADGLVGNSIRAILQDHEGVIWIGTETGLSCYRDGHFTSFKKANGLSHETILDLYEDADGVLWIGTAGGLNKFSKGTFHFYKAAQGLFRDEIFSILEDNRGSLWMSCSSGIFRVSKQNLSDFDAGKIKNINSVSYGKSDGLISAQCNSVAKPSAWKSKDGRLWFCTVRGAAVVDPELELKSNDAPPPVVIEEGIADKKLISLNDIEREKAGQRESGNSHLPIFSLSHLLIPPGRGELEFNYTVLSFLAPEKNRFKYKLVGVDRDWVEAGGRRSAHYNNIFPGEYQFQVVACNNDGVWNSAGASVKIYLQPHFWQTTLFKILMTAVGVSLVAFIYRVRVARLREIERLRIRIAADLHDEVGSSLGTISLLSRLLHKHSEKMEEKQDLATIHRISTETANSVRDIVWFINPDYDTTQDLLSRMKDSASTMLGEMQWRFDQPKENLARKLPLDFRQNIFLMFKETLANIARHSKASCVEIKVAEADGVWEMTIRDNGIGFDLAKGGNGNGLKNLQRRAEKMKGAVKIISRPGNGTTVSFATRLG